MGSHSITAADLQQAFIATMRQSDKQCIEYIENEFDQGSRQKEARAFEELDKRLKRERQLLQLKQQRAEAAEKEALEKEVEEEITPAKEGEKEEDSVAPEKQAA